MATPLADRIRPTELSEVVGQAHLLGENKPLRRIIESGNLPNLIFYGPSGVGKTTVARLIAEKTHMRLHKLNGTNASIADIKAIVDELGTFASMSGTLLYLDEIQYLNKKQQQSLLEYIENGKITLIASTTENPYFYIYNAVLSRSTVFEFKSISAEEVEPAVERAFSILATEQERTLELDNGVVSHIARACGGDVRKAVNTVELCVLSADPDPKTIRVPMELARELSQKSTFRYDRSGDEHYDTLSALQKSIRGSDVDAALHYFARLFVAQDMVSLCRRLMVIACEDIGLAYPQAMPIVKSCVDMANQLGFPEALMPLSNAVVLLATAPKSNSAHHAAGKAIADVEAGKGKGYPRHLQNKHYDGEDSKAKGQNYQYPHDYPHHWLPQQYLPDDLVNAVYYEAADNKTEQAAKAYWDKIKGQK